jgi:hypothetical protein
MCGDIGGLPIYQCAIGKISCPARSMARDFGLNLAQWLIVESPFSKPNCVTFRTSLRNVRGDVVACLTSLDFLCWTLLSSLVCVCILTGCDHARTRRALARVLQVKGPAFVLTDSDRSAERRALMPKAYVGAGQLVETGPNATAIISLLPGLIIEMKPDTRLKLDDLRVVETAAVLRSRYAGVELIHGSIYATTPNVVMNAEFQVTTPGGVLIASKNTLLCLAYARGKVRATVSWGQVRFQSKASSSATVALEAGYYEEWSAITGTPLSAPRAVDSDNEASREAHEADDFEHRASGIMSDARGALSRLRR